MAPRFNSIIPDFKELFLDKFSRKVTADSDDLLGLPYPYVAAGENAKDALFYLDTFFINMGLLRLGLVPQAKNNVENILYLIREYGYVPAANKKSMSSYSQLPLLAWMVRDIYRSTGDKGWLRRAMPDVLKEFNFWNSKEHKSSTGLSSYLSGDQKENILTEQESAWAGSLRFEKTKNYNPVDLNSILYRNALIINDLFKELEGEENSTLLNRAKQIRELLDLCWNNSEQFFYDNNIDDKKISDIKTLAGFTPLFTKLVEKQQAEEIQKHIKDFARPGGLACTEKGKAENGKPWTAPLCYAPYLYFCIKGFFNYDFMEDSADIAINWLEMVKKVYNETTEIWEWYNVEDKTHLMEGVENRAGAGWTMGTYIALTDELGLDN
jgi:alpha,alpha-trehalase